MASVEDAQKSKSPIPDTNHQQPQQQQQHSSKDKNVPKSIEDGNKRVSSRPKWARLDVDSKTGAVPSQSNAASSQNRRRSSPRRRGGDDYRGDYRDDRSIRRSGTSRGTVPPSSRGPRSGTGPASVTNNNSNTNNSNSNSTTMKPIRGSTTSSRRDNQYITRSTRPSYTESKTPGLNGNPIIKPSDTYDPKKPKQPSLIGRPIIIEAPPITPIVTNVYGTYYFNGPAPFTLDTIGNIKESIKKQM